MTEHGFVVRRFVEIDSTNSALMAESRSGAHDGLVYVADFQTAGRGRMDRTWEAPPGSCLLASVLVRISIEPSALHLVSAAVALAGAEAARQTCGAHAVLKWPNDLIIDGAKVAGVLAECGPGSAVSAPSLVGSDDAREMAIVVGIGMNLTWPGPPGVEATSLLDATGIRVRRDDLLAVLLGDLRPRLDQLASPAGRTEAARALVGAVSTIGQRVRVETPTAVIVGVASGLSAAGHLLVTGPDGTTEILTGDVIHLRPAPVQPASSE